MSSNIYRRYERRTILYPDPPWLAQLQDSVRALRRQQDKLGVLMLEEELKFNDPDADDKCGVVGRRYKVFAMTIPDCKTHRLGVSIDFKSGALAPPVMLHGVVVADDTCCGEVKRLTKLHRTPLKPNQEARL